MLYCARMYGILGTIFLKCAVKNSHDIPDRTLGQQYDNSESHDTMIRTPGGRILRFSGPTSFPVLSPVGPSGGDPAASHAQEPQQNSTDVVTQQRSSTRLAVQQTSTTLLTVSSSGGPSRKTSQFSQLNFIAPSEKPK